MPAKILVVDDSPTERRMAVTPLVEHGYVVETVTNGEEVFDAVVALRPQVVLLDIVLPRKNGFQVCRQLRTTAATAGVKVIMLSSKSQDTDRLWGLKQGADLYMTKPYEAEELLANVARLLAASDSLAAEPASEDSAEREAAFARAAESESSG